MKISMKWLSDFVKIDMPVRAYAEGMTMSGTKAEGYFTEAEKADRVVVGRLERVEKHPEADRLLICTVDTGGAEPVTVVTGAANVKVGDLVPVALNGSTLPDGRRIRGETLRGVYSDGMLCSLSELGLTKSDFPYADENGIFVLREDCAPGQDIRDAIGLNDTVVDFEITSNRPDCLSVIGIARETSAAFGLPLTLPVPRVKGAGGDIRDYLSVRVSDAELCPRYTARAVKNVRIAPSPRWMRERLRACGVRPINNIVDITNYVMLEYGQPMHAFDYACLEGGVIDVRRAREGEVMTTLDGQPRRLSADTLVIADGNKPVAVAGIMGGENSQVKDSTRVVIFESANFSGPSVRLTAKRLGMRTESSARFEKGLDPRNTLPAVERACELVELLGAGEVVDGVIDVEAPAPALRVITLDPDWINRFLDTDIPADTMADILRRLCFGVEGDRVTVPSWRADVEDKADLAEEVARIYGYDRIPSTLMRGQTTRGYFTPAQRFERDVSCILLSAGMSEITTYSFISPRCYDNLCLPADSPLRDSIVIKNPLGEDTSVMRTTALASMLEVLARNYNVRNPAAALFELATVYSKAGGDGKLPDERKQVVLGAYGKKEDYLTLKGRAETLLERLRVPLTDVVRCEDDPSFHPGRAARLISGDTVLGVLGQIHPSVQRNYGVGAPLFCAVLELNALKRCAGRKQPYRPLPKYPAVTRDLAVVCDEDMPVLDLERVIRRQAGTLLESLTLFDVYRGSQLPKGKKSAAYSLVLRAPDRTLSDTEADALIQSILHKLEERGVYLR